MDAGTVIFVILIAIIALALIGIVTQRVSDKYSISREQSSAEAYAKRQSANTFVLKELSKLGQHDVTLYENAVMEVKPAQQTQSGAVHAQGSQIGVRYIIDDLHPDCIQRRDLLRIVEHSILKSSNDDTTIRSGNKCYIDGVINPVEWTAAIKYGVERFGVVAKPRDITEVGAYGTLSKLAEAINRYDALPTPPLSAHQNGNRTA